MFLSSEEGGLSPYGAVAHPIVYPIRKIQPRAAFYVSISRKARSGGDRRVNAAIGLAKLCRRMRGRGESREFRLRIECVCVIVGVRWLSVWVFDGCEFENFEFCA